MILVKKSRKKNKHGHSGSYGFFYCPMCESVVEKYTRNGLRDKTCGCTNISRVHGGKGTDLYMKWVQMRARCNNKKHKCYNRHGGRGITVCSDWDVFIPFRDWALENGYEKGLQIDRIDNDGNYEPKNCRFVTIKENSRNSSTCKLSYEKASEIRAIYSSGRMNQIELSKKYGVSDSSISNVINNKTWA